MHERLRISPASGSHRRRPWTRLGAVAAGAHVFYEAIAGVAMPYASRVGPLPAGILYLGSVVGVYREAGRQPGNHDATFSMVNGVFLSMVIGHFASWPRRSVGGVPWLEGCEGLSGRLMPAYNAILYISAVAGVAGLVENRRGGLRGAVVPVALVPILMFESPREYARLRAQAERRRGWWNRRLQPA